MRIAIDEAGIGGPTLAYWLHRFGHEPVLIEKAPALRTGGYIVDFWGIGNDIAEKMGIVPELERRGYYIREVRWVDREGRVDGRFDTDVFRQLAGGRYVSLERSDLARSIYATVEGKIETIFGDSITGIEETSGRLRVTLDQAAPRTFDMVVGADGLHSSVREIAFGPIEQFEKDLGLRVAAFEIEGYSQRDEDRFIAYTEPGRFVSRVSKRDNKTLVLMACRDRFIRKDMPQSNEERKAAIGSAFEGVGWECRDLLRAMRDVDEIYFDRVSQIKMKHRGKGRVALAGDAAAAVSLLAGEGSGLAMAEAYVLAGEISRAKGDLNRAISEYEKRLTSFVEDKQKSALSVAGVFVPDTKFGIFFRNLVTKLLPMRMAAKLGLGSVTDDINLPEYEKAG